MSESFGAALRSARERRNLSQRVAAAWVGVRPETWQAWESGEHWPAHEHLPDIGALLGVRIELAVRHVTADEHQADELALVHRLLDSARRTGADWAERVAAYQRELLSGQRHPVSVLDIIGNEQLESAAPPRPGKR
jgi:transcriptional regulator with XRE-family HTH domain